MRLSELDRFDTIVIQCHDNPDADAISSAYALYCFFKSKNKNVRIIYGGRFFISKCNLEMMIDELDIEIKHVDELSKIDNEDTVLLTVDCQYGEGNVTKFKSRNVAIIDHHTDTNKGFELTEIRSNLGSCATLVWQMLLAEGYDVNRNKKVATALYYGLFMDTGGFAEIVHPLDRDMVDALQPDRQIINKLKNTNLSLQELETAGIALIRHLCDKKNRYALVKAHPCDPNILGLISDLLLQVNDVELCVVYNELPFGYKLSVRSCRTDVKANEFAEYITKNIGNGGGHTDKAGGFINKEKFEKKHGDMTMDQYMLEIQREYFESYDIIKADEFKPDMNEYSLYGKNDNSLGYVKSLDIVNEGTYMILRTMEGDVNICASKDIYIMIDIEKNIYPIEKAVFDKKYETNDNKFICKYEYAPKVKDVLNGNVIEIQDMAKECRARVNNEVYAKELVKPVKLFTRWDYEGYMYGNVGDYIVFARDNINDVYIVKREIMERSYSRK